MAGIWITVDEAQEIFDHFDGHCNDLVEPDGIRGMLFQSGQKFFVLRYFDGGIEVPYSIMRSWSTTTKRKKCFGRKWNHTRHLDFYTHATFFSGA